MDDLYDLLAGRDALQDLLARALGLNALRKLPGDLEMDVRSEERGAHLGQGRSHVLLGKLADAAQVAQGGGEFVGQGFKHANPRDCINEGSVATPVIAFGMANPGASMRGSHPS